MTKQEYIDSQRGKTITQIINDQPMIDVIGSIRGANLRNVVDVLAKGLQRRLDLAPDSELRTSLRVVFSHLGLNDYQINLSIKVNADMLRAAVGAELVTPAEAAEFFALATYQRPQYAITREDFGGEWVELEPTDGRTLQLRLNARAPEQTHIVIQMRDTYPDGTESDWYHATALHGVELARVYRAALPHNGSARRIRWRCEYVLAADVSVM
jgi:hypothetical protein